MAFLVTLVLARYTTHLLSRVLFSRYIFSSKGTYKALIQPSRKSGYNTVAVREVEIEWVTL